ncbi:MAG: thioredoxin domain-containing protein, partial [Acidimicrobiia bacterium]
PKEERPGLPGFVRLLEAVDDAWRTRRDELGDQAGKLHDLLAGSTGFGGVVAAGDGALSTQVLSDALNAVGSQFDPRFGGFGGAPKFPQGMTLDFLLQSYVRDQAAETLEMAQVSLDAMAAGGMYDQVGGGFHRYSVDAYWLVPHFEKMLYDQALLTSAYLHAHLVTREERYRRVVEETIGYVLRDLTHANETAFFSAEDADSEGVEGKFYVWSREEIEGVCGGDAAEVIRYFGVTNEGNFEDPHTGFRGNILHVVDRGEDRPEAVARALPELFEAREKRVRPGLDDKVLLGWNALFLRVLAEAAAALERDDWMDIARANGRFLLEQMRGDDGRLRRSWQDGRTRHLAYAEDYAALLEALVTLAEVDDVEWLAPARSIADDLLRLFHDDTEGGFFTTGHDAEVLIVRPKDFQDNATPAENSLAANGLLRLAALTGEKRYDEAGREVPGVLAPVMGEHPTAFAYLLGAFERAVTPPLEIALVGDSPELRREVFGRLLPATVTICAEAGKGAELTPLLEDRALVDGRSAAYVCEHFTCQRPATDPVTLRAQLDTALAARRPDRSGA